MEQKSSMRKELAMVTREDPQPEEGVGCRVESGGFYGTIRFIGPLPNYPGIWYGIEWDDPTRGKHNGTVNGMRYFETRYPTSGSFVRRDKIVFGISLMKAIDAKYGKEESDIVKKIHEQQIVNLQKTMKAPFIEFVGFEKVSTKQSNFESLEIVDVRGQKVSYIGIPGELKSLFPNIKHLDLSKNLLTQWEQVFNICAQLDRLYFLNVSENVLDFPEDCKHIFPSVGIFICGHMNLSWKDIKKLSKIFPNISELRANDNNITDLTTVEENSFNNLRILDLEANPIGSWNEIMKLNEIKNLSDLSIENIGLEKINFKTDQAKVDCLRNLTKLNINNNLINDWLSISELNKLPNLEELRFQHNPILNTEELDTAVALITAKVDSLKILNGRRLFNEFRTGNAFRRGCEYDYLKKYGLEWLRVKGTPNEASFLREHNRYLDLIDMYGEPELSELQIKDTSMLKNTLISLNLVFQTKIVTKRVPPTMLVQRLKILVQKLFRLDIDPKLVCKSENEFEIPLDDDTKELHYFSVKDNDTIFVKI